MKYFVASDIHGRGEDLLFMLPKLEKAIKKLKSNEYKVLFLGDYCDRGPNNFVSLHSIMCFQQQHFHNTIVLKGNHEEFIYGSYEFEYLDSDSELRKYHKSERTVFDTWTCYSNGGEKTYKELRELREDYYQDMIKYLVHLPDRYEDENFIFTHAPINRYDDSRPLSSYSSSEVLWNIRTNLHVAETAKYNIHGHLHKPFFDEANINKANKTINVTSMELFEIVTLDVDDNKKITVSTLDFSGEGKDRCCYIL